MAPESLPVLADNVVPLNARQTPKAAPDGILGTLAAESGYRVRYTLASKLVNELVEAADDAQLSKLITRYGRVDLLLIDELGYLQLDRRGAELLFQVLTEREERSAVAIADRVEAGMSMTFCRRDAEAARRDLMRICAEIREELSPEDGSAPGRILGAIYVSCSGRGGPHFGGPSAELQILRHALGEVPLVGFFAGGEIARRHLYGYTGVLTVFVEY